MATTTTSTWLTNNRGAGKLGLLSPNAKAPIKVWAFFGAMLIIFQSYVMIKWVTGPYFESVPAGPTEVPRGVKVGVWVNSIIFCVTGPLVVWFWAIRPRIRNGQWTTEGLVTIWCAVLAWTWDPVANMFNQVYTYNSYALNMGSWVNSFPFWPGVNGGKPGAMMAEPLLMIPVGYTVGVVWFMFLTVAMMRWMRGRYPNLSNFSLILISASTVSLFECVIECAWIRTGFYGYRAAIPQLTLFDGQLYQFPIYEFVLAAALWAAGASFLYFKNDKGQTWAERGLERLKIGQKTSTMVRFCAVTAICTLIYLGSWMLPHAAISLWSQEWPREAQERSYFTNHICGPETDHSCGSPWLPLPGPNTAHFDPHGNVVIPPGVPQPGSESVTTFRP